MAELSQQDKDRIILEEQFRVLTKAELESQRPKKSLTAWEYLNSSLVLLLMSSVVISGIGSLFTSWKAKHEKELAKEAERSEKLKRAARIDAEIGYRVSVLLVSLDAASEDPSASVSSGKLSKGHTATEIKQTLNRVVVGRSPEVPSLYPEFGNSSILQLATELNQWEETNKIGALGRVIADMGGIELMPAETYANPLKIASFIQQKLNQYPPWRDGDFYFTDCTPETPFC